MFDAACKLEAVYAIDFFFAFFQLNYFPNDGPEQLNKSQIIRDFEREFVRVVVAVVRISFSDSAKLPHKYHDNDANNEMCNASREPVAFVTSAQYLAAVFVRKDFNKFQH